MSIRIRTIRNLILKNHIENAFCFYSTVPKSKIIDTKGQLLIKCKRKHLNHYSLSLYNKLDEVPLASKGWNHSKAKDDFFTVHPYIQDILEPTYSFNSCGINMNLIDKLNARGIEEATEFQYRAICAIDEGSHVLLAAETGCGKTISYLLPIIKNLIQSGAPQLNTPKALVIVPNRELAYQIGEVAQYLAKSVNLNVKVLVGGRTKNIMMNPTFEKIDILVATPGILGKLSTLGVYKLNEVQHMVLDEADSLIDDSFIERMNGIINRAPQSQIILVSATLPKKLPDMLIPIESTLKHVVSPRIHKPLLNITQKFLRLSKSMKPCHLLQIVKSNNFPMLIFSNKNETCNWVALFLRENGVTCANINGDMNHQIRIDQWNQFVKGDTQILSATDVGSRGLDTIQVRHVLNYDFPFYAADYIHRIGRVGRLGSHQSSKVTNFISDQQEIALVQQIELAIRRNQSLRDVDGNITNLVQKKIARQIRESA